MSFDLASPPPKDDVHPAFTDQSFTLNEKGNADRVLVIHGGNLLYHNTENTWFVYDGQRFSDGLSGDPGAGGEAGVKLLIHEYLDDLWALPRSAATPDLAEALEKFVRQSGTRKMVSSIISLIRPRVTVNESELDPDPYALNTPSGVVDLRTGELSPHDRKHRCTQITGAPHNSAALSDAWDDFVMATLPDTEVRVYFQKCMGYSLLGVQPEQVFFFIHGRGATGKSTMMKAIQGACGSYHKAADFSTFLDSRFKSSGGPSPDLSRLSRARVVSATEVGHGQALDDGLLKQLSGGDVVTARGLYAEHQEWRPAMAIWLVANDRPKGRVDDDALWRRLRPFEFTQKVSGDQIDAKLGARLSTLECRTAILAWMIEGVQHYLHDGHLDPPASVLAGVEDYRASSNPLNEFFEDECVRGEGYEVSRPDLWAAYLGWSQANHARPISKKQFNSIVGEDYLVVQVRGIRTFRGIAPKVSPQPTPVGREFPCD